MVEISWKKTKYRKNAKGMLNHSLSIVFEEYFPQIHPSQNICRTIFLSIMFEEYFLQTHPPQNIYWTAHCQLCLKNISYRPIHPRIYMEPFIVNCAWRIFPTDPSTLEYILNHSLSIVFEEYFLQTHPPHNICWTAHCQLYLKYISYRAFHPRIYVESLIVNCVWRIFPTEQSIPEYMLNRWLSIVFEKYFLETHPSQNICWTIHWKFCLKNIFYRSIHPRIYVESLIVNCVWRIFPTDPSTPQYMLNRSLSVVFEEYCL